MCCLGLPRSCIGLDLNADHPAIGTLYENVHLMAAVGISYVEQVRRVLADRTLGTKLCHHECVNDPAQQIVIAQHRMLIYAKQRPNEARIDQVPLRQTNETVQVIVRPSRELLGYEEPF